MSKTWYAADHHFGHRNIINFTYGASYPGKSNDRIRPFASVEEMHETIIERHNAVVSDEDRVYLMGDVAIAKWGLSQLARLKGRLILIRGNHDIFKLKDYLPYFDDVRSCKVNADFIATHIPVHPDCVKRYRFNVHGHLHVNSLNDPRYLCVSLEHTDFAPISHDEVKRRLNATSVVPDQPRSEDLPK